MTVLGTKSFGAVAATTALAAGVGIVGAAPARADVETRGMCSAGSAWEADLDREYGAYGLGFEIKTATPGERWRLEIKQNGSRVLTSTRAARADYDDRYAEVDWEVVRPDRRGVRDRFAISARNLTTGESCNAAIRG